MTISFSVYLMKLNSDMQDGYKKLKFINDVFATDTIRFTYKPFKRVNINVISVQSFESPIESKHLFLSKNLKINVVILSDSFLFLIFDNCILWGGSYALEKIFSENHTHYNITSSFFAKWKKLLFN